MEETRMKRLITFIFVCALVELGTNRTASASGEHFCWGSDPVVCDAPTSPLGANWRIRIGSDSEGQWIAWQAPDGNCEWELLAPPEGMDQSVIIEGGLHDDSIAAAQPSGETVCGFPLQPPIQNG